MLIIKFLISLFALLSFAGDVISDVILLYVLSIDKLGSKVFRQDKPPAYDRD